VFLKPVGSGSQEVHQLAPGRLGPAASCRRRAYASRGDQGSTAAVAWLYADLVAKQGHSRTLSAGVREASFATGSASRVRVEQGLAAITWGQP
jgi:hypothetical protein